jgi:hypothetical protein
MKIYFDTFTISSLKVIMCGDMITIFDTFANIDFLAYGNKSKIEKIFF